MMKYLDGQQKIIVKVLFIIVLFVCISSFIMFLKRDAFAKKGEFVAPPKEYNAINGLPNDYSKDCMYQEAKVTDDYIIYLCAAPTIKNNKLKLYFTSIKTNKGLMKIKVLDARNNEIGECGLIEPNSYIKEIILNKELKAGDKITVRVMNYEKDTYYSLGEIKLDLFVRVAL